MPEWERITRENAAREWDQTVPRWSMDRETFIGWHVRMRAKTERKRK